MHKWDKLSGYGDTNAQVELRKWTSVRPWFEHLLTAAGAGCVPAMEGCGLQYSMLDDWEQAVHWFTKAAQAGSCIGRVHLAR